MRVVFMGTPDFAVPSLEKLIEKHDVIGVFTQPDRPKGRGQRMQISPIKAVANKKGIPVYQPLSLKKESSYLNILKEIKPDVIVVVAFGQILPSEVLNLPPLGCINVHASLLPKLRGAAPINWAIIRGDKKTGVTTMLMNEGLDTGDMLLKKELSIDDKDTAETLHDKLMERGADLIIETLECIENKKIYPQKQDDTTSTYAPMLTKELGHIDWNMECKDVYNLIRGVTPWPGAYCDYNGSILKIWKAYIESFDKTANPGQIINLSRNGIEVGCKTGSIVITEVQGIGSKRMDAFSYLNGHNIKKGELLK